jgi:hypothetical protein
MENTEKPLLKKVAWVAGTLFLGGLGSGLWEAALKPSATWVGRFALGVVTLGMKSLKNDLYQQVAKGFHEQASVSTLSLFSGCLAGFVFSAVLIPYMRRNRGSVIEKPFIWSSTGWKIWLIPLFFITFIFFQVFRTSFITRGSNHLEQTVKIISPYIDSEERVRFQSKCALIQSREDFITIQNEAKSIAAKNSVTLPTFEPF